MEIDCKVDGSATAGLGPGIKELRAIQQQLKLASPDVGMPALSEFGFRGLEGNVPLGMSRQDLQGFSSVDATQADKLFGKKASQNESPKRPKRFVRSGYLPGFELRAASWTTALLEAYSYFLQLHRTPSQGLERRGLRTPPPAGTMLAAN